ncbi:hypothetical protein ASZ90_011089 [hydrocarbon metagenome]|uniref:Uncharacterized protein n=1 Tax=hydrocarbon metagenome TaxID=938273 RepID=A0A0W8FE85_9ZZZZ
MEGDRLRLAPGTQILTGVAGAGTRIAPDSREYQKALDQKPEVFETVHSAVLSRAQNEMRFYAWGDRRCCLPAGATEAWLAGDLSGLMAGDVLIVAEHRDPRTGRPEEADRMHRHAVRLTHVRVTGDPVRSADGGPAPVTLIRWDAADALPAAFCISGSVSPDGKREEYCEDLSIALGNIVLADAGRTLPGAEALGTVAAPALFFAADPQETGNPCARPAQQPVLPRFRPRLGAGPLTHALPYAERTLFGLAFAAGEEDLLARQVESLDDRALPPYLHQAFMNRGIVFAAESLSIQGRLDEWSISDGTQAYRIRLENAHEDAPERLLVSSLPPPAAAVRELSPEEARPAVRLSSRMSGREQAFSWSPVRDLLNSAPEAREYVIETESDGSAWIRFGDGSFGMRPASGEEFFAAYRTGNGPEGNVGSETLVHMVAHDPSIVGVNNPLPAFGGTAPESIDRVREIAPSMFRRQERAVTPEDYAALAMRHPSVQRAAAALQWTGSWYTVFLTVDRFGGREVDEPFKEELLAFLDRYRFMGQDLEIRGPRHVPLEIAVRICVKSGYDRSDVARELISTFSAGRRPDGRRGIFHPDNFSLGQPVYLSHIYRAAGEIEGVSACEVTTFRRLGQPGNEGIDAGRLAIRKFECARLDNDPNFPEHGVFRMELRGG